MQRNAKQQFTFSDGTIIPAGAKIGTPSLNLHRDPIGYEDPDAFDGFRFSRKGDTATSPRDAAKFSMVNTAADYQLFGHGKHAWYVFSPRRSGIASRMDTFVLTLLVPAGSMLSTR